MAKHTLSIHDPMQRLLENVWNDQRFPAVLITHDVTEAVILADRVLLIERRVIWTSHISVTLYERQFHTEYAYELAANSV